MPGPCPTPTRLKLLRGNPGKRAIKSEPKPKIKIPRCPTNLDADARTEWKRIGRELAKIGLVSEIDRATLTIYCQAWSDFRRARRHLLCDSDFVCRGTHVDVPSAWKRLSDEALKQIRQCCSEFGLSPAARVRLATETKPEGSNDDAFRNAAAGG